MPVGPASRRLSFGGSMLFALQMRYVEIMVAMVCFAWSCRMM